MRPPTQHYKKRASQVRGAARAHLRELRQARLAKRDCALPSEASDESFGALAAESAHDGDPFEAALTAEAEISAASEIVASDVQELGQALAKPAGDAEGSFIDTPHPEDDDVENVAIANLAMSEMVADMDPHPDAAFDVKEREMVEVPEASSPETGGVLGKEDVDPPGETGPVSVAASEPDLEILPGAGPGLIWMLNQCGISSLAELADAEPAVLTRDLGVVGQILNVETWIAFAKKRVS